MVVFKVLLRAGEQVLLPAVEALDVARAVRLLHQQAKEAERASAARHVLGQVCLKIVLQLAVRARAADASASDVLRAQLLVSSTAISRCLDTHLRCITRRLEESPRRILKRVAPCILLVARIVMLGRCSALRPHRVEFVGGDERLLRGVPVDEWRV